MTPLERAARVLAKREYPDQPDEWHDSVWREYLDDAGAVVAAIREPSDLMGLGLGKMGGEYRPGSHSASQIWRAMIDAMLEEG